MFKKQTKKPDAVPIKTLKVYKSDQFSEKSELDGGKGNTSGEMKKRGLFKFGQLSMQNTIRDEEKESERKGESSDPSGINIKRAGGFPANARGQAGVNNKDQSGATGAVAAAATGAADGAAAKEKQQQKSQKAIKIRLDGLRFMLEKDRKLTLEFSIQMQNQIMNERNHFYRIKKNIEYCMNQVIPKETVEATRDAFESFCQALQFSQEELMEHVKFLEDSAVPSIDYLTRQIGFIDLLITDFERKLTELYEMELVIQKLKSAQNQQLKLRQLQEKAQKDAEYSGINLRNKLQLYIKDRNSEMRELVLHINRNKVQYHGQSLSYFTAFFFKVLERDPSIGRPDNKKEQKRRFYYFKQCKNILRDLLREKKVDKYIPYSDEESDQLGDQVDQESVVEGSDIEEKVTGKDSPKNLILKKGINEVDQKDQNDPILEKMNFDGQFTRINNPPIPSSIKRASMLF